MDTFITNLKKDIFQNLKNMDQEANIPVGTRKHAGLIDYRGFYKTTKGITFHNYETPIYHRLGELLTSETRTIEEEAHYPHPYSSLKCDLLITDSALENKNTKIWLETKIVWRDWWGSEGRMSSGYYKDYFFGASYRKDSVKDDFYKLEQIPSSYADYLSILVIGFDSNSNPIDADVYNLFINEKLQESGWQICGKEIWPDVSYPKCRISCWFFSKKF